MDQEHRELLADVLLGDVDVYLREVLDKKWCDGGKILTFLCFLCSIRLNLVKPSGKDTIEGNKRFFCIKNTVYFAQKKDYSQRTKF